MEEAMNPSTPIDSGVKQRKSPRRLLGARFRSSRTISLLDSRRFGRCTTTPTGHRPPADGILDLPTLNDQRKLATFLDADVLKQQNISSRLIRKRLVKKSSSVPLQGTPFLVACFVSLLLFPMALLLILSQTSLTSRQYTQSLRFAGVKPDAVKKNAMAAPIQFVSSKDYTPMRTADDINRYAEKGLFQPQKLARKDYKMGFLPDHGTIEYHKLTLSAEFLRVISDNDTETAEAYRDSLLEEIDGDLRSQFDPKEDREDKEERCRDPSWVSDKFFSCNQIHEMVIERPFDDLFNKALDPLDYGYLQDYDVSYLSHGTFRDAWRFHRPNTQDDFVLKRFMLHKKYNQGDIHTIHKEAIIMERLMPSPRIMDIYGYCGTSVLVEAMASEVAYSRIIPSDGLASQAELDNLDDAYPRNNLTIGEKLQLSLSMAESLVDLHEFREGGLIVHSDTHIEQWLVAPDKTLKLNDFNNAHVMRWDDKRQEYCTRHSMYGGTWRAPEEYDGSSQDETKDTFSFANGIYAMITGLWPFYDDAFNGINEDTIEEAIIAGKRPFVDERYRQRSFIEKMLVEVMEACWAQDRKDRPTMTRVVEILKKVKATAWKKGELKPSSWIDIPMPE